MGISRLILSDIHAGLATSRWEEVPGIIARNAPKQVIMVGDLYDSAPFLPWGPWTDALRQICKSYDVVLIRGNHDWEILPAMASSIGMKCYDTFEWNDVNGSNIAIHGHQFDQMIIEHPELSQVATEMYASLQQVAGVSIAEFMKHVSKTFSRDATRVERGARLYAEGKGVQNIRCGHVHSYGFGSADGLSYWNDNCCCDKESGYFTIRDDGYTEYITF